jgi:hypothetical protein
MKTVNGITLYTVDEVAEQLNINRLTVLKYIKQGRLYAQRIGRPYMITEQDLRQFLTGIISENIRTVPVAQTA